MNSILSLIRYAKLENGWLRGKIIKQANGKIKHYTASINLAISELAFPSFTLSIISCISLA